MQQGRGGCAKGGGWVARGRGVPQTLTSLEFIYCWYLSKEIYQVDQVVKMENSRHLDLLMYFSSQFSAHAVFFQRKVVVSVPPWRSRWIFAFL